MQFQDLRELIGTSRSSRRYFLSLPVPIQMQLHACNAWIHSLQDLHQLAGYYTKQQEKWTI